MAPTLIPPQTAWSAPSPVYVSGEESLRLTSFANLAGLTLTLTARVMTLDGTIHANSVPHAPNSNRTAATSALGLPEGWLLGVTAAVTAGSSTSGAVWVKLELVRGAAGVQTVLQTLVNDFCSTNSPSFWPGGQCIDPTDGPGNLRVITGTQPGAGADISETVPTNVRWELLSFLAGLTTSVTVATRFAELVLDDGTNNYGFFPQGIGQAASLGWNYTWGQGVNRFQDVAINVVAAGVPVGIRLGAGHRIRTNTGFIQAGDQWSAPHYLVREWFDI